MSEFLTLLRALARPSKRAKDLRRVLKSGGYLRARDFVELGLQFGVTEIEARYLDRYAIRVPLAGGAITEGVLEDRAFQSDLFSFFAAQVADRSLAFMNVGANVGTTVLNAHQNGFRKFLACEPVAANFRLLASNLAQIAADSALDLQQIALGDVAEMREIHLDPASTGRHSMVRDVGRGGEVVEVRRLDAIAPQVPGALWVDAEGFEAEIVAGGSEYLARWCRAMCIEVTPDLLGPEKLRVMDARLERIFGRCLTLEGGSVRRLSEVPAIQAGRQTDVILLP